MVGGLLVAVAAVGTWWAAAGDGGDRAPRYVVAGRAVGPGEHLSADDLALTAVELPESLRRAAFTDPDEVVGSVSMGPLAPGELVQAGSIGAGAGTPEGRELSFSVEAEWAVAGTIRPGDRIDLLATYGDGASAETGPVLEGAVVRRIAETGGDGIGETSRQTITVTVDDPADIAPTVNAARAGSLTVLRATGTADRDTGDTGDADDARAVEADGDEGSGGRSSGGTGG